MALVFYSTLLRTRATDEREMGVRPSAIADFAESLGILVRYALGLDYIGVNDQRIRRTVEPTPSRTP